MTTWATASTMNATLNLKKSNISATPTVKVPIFIILANALSLIRICPEQEPMEFTAIPISDGIKGMYKFGDSTDAVHLKRLTKLANV